MFNITNLLYFNINIKMNCPEGKIFNPATGRCVKIDGKVGKKLLEQQRGSVALNRQKNKPQQSKECPTDKILNPATGRCVKRTGKVGKKLLEQQTNSSQPVPQPDQNKECSPDKIVNPETGRCVKRTGKVGRKIIFARESGNSSNISFPSYRY